MPDVYVKVDHLNRLNGSLKQILVEFHDAAAALAVGRPVMLRYSRMDDFLAANPAPDCRISVKLGATREGVHSGWA